MSYASAMVSLKNILVADSSIGVDSDAIIIQPDRDEFVTRYINNDPSISIRIIESPEKTRDASAAKSVEMNVVVAVDICKLISADAANQFDADLIDIASSVEELLQFSTLSDQVGITMWEETQRYDDYGDAVMCYRVAFNWKKTV